MDLLAASAVLAAVRRANSCTFFFVKKRTSLRGWKGLAAHNPKMSGQSSPAQVRQKVKDVCLALLEQVERIGYRRRQVPVRDIVS